MVEAPSSPQPGMSTDRRKWPRQSAKFLIRYALLRIMRMAMRFRAHVYPVDSDTRCLVVAPHQDDAALGCGGLIICKRLEGNPVDIVYVTDGSASHPGHPTLTPERLASQRRSEELAAIVTLGVERTRAHFLDAKDGTLSTLEAAERERIVAGMAEIMLRTRPDEIFLPCRLDGSSEHDASFVLVRDAIQRSLLSPRTFEYPIWALWSPQRLVAPLVSSQRVWTARFGGYEHLKLSALRMYRSQMESSPPWTEPVISREFVSFFGSCEEFFFESDVS